MPIEDFMISVFVGVDDTRKALFGSPKPGRTRGPAPAGRTARCGRWSGEGSFGDTTRIKTPFASPGSTSFRTWPESIGLGGCDRRPAWCGSRSDCGDFCRLGSLPTAGSRSSTVFPSMCVSRPESIESGSFGMRRPGVSGGIGVSHGPASSPRCSSPRPTSRTSSWRGSGVGGWATAGTGPPERRKAFSQQGLALLAPPNGWTSWLTQTVIRQRTERFHAQRTWARDSRIFRKVLRPTLAVFLNRREGREPLPLSLLGTS